MGLLKAITDAIKEKAKEEIVQYLKKIAEENAAKPAAGNKPQERHDHKPQEQRHDKPQERRDERKPYPPQERQGYDPNNKPDRNDKYDNRFDKYADKYNDKFNAPKYDNGNKYDNRNDRNDKYDNRGDRYEKNDKYDNGNKYDGGNKYDSRNDRPAYPDQKPLPKPEPRPEHRPEPKPEFKQAERPPLPKPEVKPAPAPVAAPVPVPQPRPEIRHLPPKKEEIILPLNEEPIEKVQMVVRGDDIILPYDLARLIQPLPVNEYSLYVKLYLYSYGIRKNYGYVGAGLKKSIGIDELDAAEFGRLLERLDKRGLVSLEKISEHQSTYILYLPFDEKTMKRVEEKKREEEEPPAIPAPKTEPRPAAAKNEPRPAPRGKEKEKEKTKEPEKGRDKGKGREPEKGKGKAKEPEHPAPKGRGGRGRSVSAPEPEKKQPVYEELPDEPMIPGRSNIELDDDGLMKAYRTFVSMEIDKAKMRVGRSNFDKIYMEAVKYIDKKYGFKVLSDQERFREYLTQYYISAFDIPNYDNWKKTKG